MKKFLLSICLMLVAYFQAPVSSSGPTAATVNGASCSFGTPCTITPFTFWAECDGTLPATAGTYALPPFGASSVTSLNCASLTSADVPMPAPVTTLAGKCNAYALGSANATNNVTLTVNDASSSITGTVSSGGKPGHIAAGSLAVTAGDNFWVTITIGTSEAWNSPHILGVCW
jgi:hypothetical protein